MALTAHAVVAHEPDIPGTPNLKLEDVAVREELKDDEVLVKMIASGICHTDLVVSGRAKEYMDYPKVLGHEGAGIVQHIGKCVTRCKPGDSVLLSFISCTHCNPCITGHPAYCSSFNALNMRGQPGIFSSRSQPQNSKIEIIGSFFGQSSFASLSIVKEASVVNVTGLVKGDEQLKMFAPMGCGFQTGSGTVSVLSGAGEGDSVVVMGVGGVGLSAIMAAKIQGCHTIIGVDRIAGRLDLAKEVGATHVVKTSDSDLDLVIEVMNITKNVGSMVTVDTTGNLELIKKGMEFTGRLGQLIILGIPPRDAVLGVHLSSFLRAGKQLRSSIEGDVVPSKHIPQMIRWHEEGKFPIEKLIKFYPVEEFQKAVDDMHNGVTVKPVIVW